MAGTLPAARGEERAEVRLGFHIFFCIAPPNDQKIVNRCDGIELGNPGRIDCGKAKIAETSHEELRVKRIALV
jgi:hypothetical protein